MMDYLGKIKAIRLKLIEIQYQDLSDEILKLQLSGGTGGEVLISVCSRLLKIQKEHIDVFRQVENEARELIKYANSIGLYPR